MTPVMFPLRGWRRVGMVEGGSFQAASLIISSHHGLWLDMEPTWYGIKRNKTAWFDIY
jgi:hypothetical protein